MSTPFEFMKEDEIKRSVLRGDLLWCWCFKEKDGEYFHDYANMGPSNVKVTTDVKLRLVYVTEDPSDKNLWNTYLEKSPNIS